MKRNNKGQFIKQTDGVLIDGHKSWITPKGYRQIWYNNKAVMAHVYLWEDYYNCKKPDGFEIHHIDGNKLNNNIHNLLLLTNSIHQKIHKGWIFDNTGFTKKLCSGCNNILSLDNFYERKTAGTPSALCKSCHNIRCKQRANINKEQIRKYKQEWYRQKKLLK